MKSKGEELFLQAWRVFVGKPEPEREYRFAPPRRWRFDFAWPDYQLAVEIEGGTWVNGRHNRGSSIEADLEKYNHAAMLGWRVIRLSTAMVRRDGPVWVGRISAVVGAGKQ